MITLKSGDWRCALRPEVGGAIGALQLRGIDVLRPTPDGVSDALETACFALVPYCNRIRDGRFSFGDEAVQLSPNLLPQPHSLHGLGWRLAWTVEAYDESSALLVHEHDGQSEWPWAYRAEQRIALDPQGLDITLKLINHSDRAMPAGLGLHPYFRRTANTRVRFTAGALIESDSELLPTGRELAADSLAPWSAGTSLPDSLVDHCHARWTGSAWIDDELGSITMSASNAPHLHVYAPPGGTPLCLEPVSHLPDALNLNPAEMAMLQPGEAVSLTMRIEAS